MSGNVKLRLGDMFDKRVDMLVLPCSTLGSITQSLQQRFQRYQLPMPTPNLKLGDVQIMPFIGGERIATFLAFAASVQQGASTPEAIKKIGVQIGKFTRLRPSVQTIAAPLLGTGSGNLESEIAANSLREGFISAAAPNSTLIIYVSQRDVYERLKRLALSGELTIEKQLDQPLNEQKRPIRNQVFISYSHTDAKWLSRLQVHIKPLERDNMIKRWDDTLIKPGTKWREQIRSAIESAKVAVLLISAEFLASDFIVTNELPPLLAAAESEGAVILPIIISPCLFLQTKTLAQFQSVNPPSKPLTGMRRINQDQVFVKVAEAIADVLSS